jgi:multidrug efflux system outer membrane protein
MLLVSKCSLILVLLTGSTQPLDVFLEAAAKQSFDTREARATLEQREGEAMQTWGKLLPSASITGNYTRNQQQVDVSIPNGVNADGTPSVNTVTFSSLNQLDATLSASLTLIDVQTWVRTAAQVGSVEAQRQRLAVSDLETERQVVKAYYVLLAAEAFVRSTEQTLAAQEASAALTAERKAAGLAAELDVRRNRVEVERAKQNVSDARYSLLAARRALKTLTGIEPAAHASDSWGLDDDLADARVDETRLKLVPAVLAASLDVTAARRNKAAAFTALIPTLSLQVNERVTSAPGFSPNPFWSVVISARWTLDAGIFATARVQSAQAEVAAIKAERAERSAFDQLDDARELVASTIVKSRAADAQLDEATLAASLAKDRFAEGKATQLDVIQAERDVLDAKVSRIRVHADLKYARALVTLSEGRSLRKGAKQ